LSSQAVVAASRGFICIRLACFENPEETAFLNELAAKKPGKLKNSTFALLTPDAKTRISRVGRTPFVSYESDAALAEAMQKASEKYSEQETPPRSVPWSASLRLGLNIASCDIVPLVMVVASSEESRNSIEQALAPIAWSPEFVGVFEYARVAALEEAKAISGVPQGDCVVVVEPNEFGLAGKVLAATTSIEPAAIAETLRAGRQAYVPKGKDTHSLIDAARALDIRWRDDPGPEAHRIRRD